MKKIMLLILTLLLSTPIFSAFNHAPWIIIENTSPFPFTCQIILLYYYTDYDNKEITFDTNNEKIQAQYKQGTDLDGKNCILFFLNIESASDSTIYLESLFTVENKLFYPTIHSVSFTQKSLQLATLCDNITNNNRYFSVYYEPYDGIHTTAQPLSLYAYCMYNCQQIAKQVVFAATYLKNWLSSEPQ